MFWSVDVQLHSVVIFRFSWKVERCVGHEWDGSVQHITNGNLPTAPSPSMAGCGFRGSGRTGDQQLWLQHQAYGLMFLGAHFVWAFSLMFLFSGRGYWQELIESIVGLTTS